MSESDETRALRPDETEILDRAMPGSGSKTSRSKPEVIHHHTDWTTAIVVTAVSAAVAAAIWAFCWLGVSVSRADREFRSTRAEQCQKIENESTRTLCVSRT